MPELLVRHDAAKDAWDQYVQTREGASIYHRAAWAAVVGRSFGHETVYLSAWEDDRVVGILPLVFFRSPFFGRFATSMPFVNYGGVLADSEDAARALLDAAIREATRRRVSYVELRHVAAQFKELPVRSHKVSMVLPLQTTVELQWQALDRKLRNQVRKAEKSGLTIESGGRELLNDFYDVLAQNMRDLGSPVHGKGFFDELLSTFDKDSRLFVIRLGEQAVAASIVLWHGDRIEVPWASALRAHNALCPNVLLYWEMLKFSIGRGFRAFDFGRCTPFEGTYQFKQQWGAMPEPLHWEYWLQDGVALPDRSPKNQKFSRAIKIWQQLPVGLTRLLGPRIVCNIP